MAARRAGSATGADAPTTNREENQSSANIGLLEFIGTCFEAVPGPVMTRLLARSHHREIPAGRSVFPLDQVPHVGLILQGTARSFLTAADGRQLTVRYARRGAIVGKYATLVGAHAPLAVEALSDCTVLEFDTDVFQACIATEISVSSAVNVELGRRLEDVYATVGDSAFGSIRQRLIRHMLALATEADPDLVPRVTLTQQQLADAIGSSREVVARELGRLRRDELIRTDAGAIDLLSVDRLVSSLNSWQAESPY